MERERSEERKGSWSCSGNGAVRGLNWLLKFRSKVILLKLCRPKSILTIQDKSNLQQSTTNGGAC